MVGLKVRRKNFEVCCVWLHPTITICPKSHAQLEFQSFCGNGFPIFCLSIDITLNIYDFRDSPWFQASICIYEFFSSLILPIFLWRTFKSFSFFQDIYFSTKTFSAIVFKVQIFLVIRQIFLVIRISHRKLWNSYADASPVIVRRFETIAVTSSLRVIFHVFRAFFCFRPACIK